MQNNSIPSGVVLSPEMLIVNAPYLLTLLSHDLDNLGYLLLLVGLNEPENILTSFSYWDPLLECPLSIQIIESFPVSCIDIPSVSGFNRK